MGEEGMSGNDSVGHAPDHDTKRPAPHNSLAKMLDDYGKSLEEWREVTKKWQLAAAEAVKRYNAACAESLRMDAESLNTIYEMWQESWNEIGPAQTGQMREVWDGMFNAEHFQAMKKFVSDFERVWLVSPEKQFEAYGKVLADFNENWGRVIKS